jgi:hypothetical protein
VESAAQIERLEVVSDRERIVGEAGCGQLSRAELAGKVDQRQRVAAGRHGDLRRCRRVDGLGQRRHQQPDRRLGTEPGEVEGRDTCHLCLQAVRVAAGEHQRHRFGFEASGHERQYVQRLRIQQVSVVDGAHDRLDLPGRG